MKCSYFKSYRALLKVLTARLQFGLGSAFFTMVSGCIKFILQTAERALKGNSIVFAARCVTVTSIGASWPTIMTWAMPHDDHPIVLPLNGAAGLPRCRLPH